MLHKTRVAIRFRAKTPSPQTTRNFALVCLVRTDGRAVGRSVYGHVVTKFSRMGSLPHFVTHGAPLRASRERAPLLEDDGESRCLSLVFTNMWVQHHPTMKVT